MNEAAKPNFKAYVIGFTLSIILTLAAYSVVVSDKWRSATIMAVILVLAVIQLFVQIIFFLHVGKESKPRWNLIAMSFAAMVVLILVFGSLWIMKNLNYGHEHHHTTPEQDSQYIIKDELIHH